MDAKVRKFEQVREEHASAKSALDVGRKLFRELLRQALAAGYAIIRNTLRDDSIALEAWEAARRYPRAARFKKPGLSPIAEQPVMEQSQPQPEPQPKRKRSLRQGNPRTCRHVWSRGFSPVEIYREVRGFWQRRPWP